MHTSVDVLKAFFVQKGQDQKFDPTEIRLSDVGNCPRKQTLRILGFESDQFTHEQLGVFEAGNVWEDWLLSRWEEAFPGLIVRNVDVRTQWGVGHIDAVHTGFPKLLEVKTTMNKNKGLLPYSSNLWQLKSYLWFYGKPNGITEGELVYVLKDDFQVLPFAVHCSEEEGRQIEERLRTVYEAVQRGKPLPVPANYSPGSFPCKWKKGQCGFYDNCW